MNVLSLLRRLTQYLSPLGFGLAAFGILTGTYLSQTHHDREQALGTAAATAEKLSRALEEHTRDTFVAVDAVLQSAGYQIQERLTVETADPAAIETILRQGQESLPFLHAISFLGPDGRTILTSRGTPIWSTEPSARPYFHAHAAGEEGLEIGLPVRSEVDGGWTIPLSRRLEMPDGRFAGVLVAALEPGHFKAFYDAMQIGTKGTVALLASDGTLLFREPYEPAWIGRSLAHFGLHFQEMAQSSAGVYPAPDRIDGVERIVAYRRMSDRPLVVLVGISENEALAAWRAQGDEQGTIWLVASLAVMVLAGLLIRHRQRERRAAGALRESERRYRLLAENASDAIVVLDKDYRRTYVSPAYTELTGYAFDELMGKAPFDFAHPQDIGRVNAAAETVMAGTRQVTVEYRLRRKDGSYRWVEASLSRFTDPQSDGRPEYVAVIRGIDRRKAVEHELRESHEYMNFALEAARAGVWHYDLDTGRVTWSEYTYRLFGLDPGEPVPSHEAWLQIVHPDDRAAVDRATRHGAASRQGNQYLEFRILHPDLGLRWLVSYGRLIRGGNGDPRGVFGINLDITERKLDEEALRVGAERLHRSEMHLMQAQAIAHLGSWEMELPTKHLTWSAEMFRIIGLEGPDPTIEEVFALVHPEDRHLLHALLSQAAGGGMPETVEGRIIRPDGQIRLVRCAGMPIKDDGGEVVRIVGTLQDVTDLRQGEERRRELESQLQQAQKMEAVGQLTGGIAHDFNNLLAVIIGNLDLAEMDRLMTAGTRELIVTARDAGLRGAELTGQLLSFARRQPLQPRPTDINTVIAGHTRLLERLLGGDIEISLEPGDDLGQVEIDVVQFETALTNLATNARDAMPQGGRLSIVTRNAQLDEDYAAGHEDLAPGHYALVEITDSGTGMTPEVRQRVFEPFFTTKGVGKGSGLGLSMVYGFIKQSGGHIAIYSEPGRGTTIRLYLPSLGHRRKADDQDPAGADQPLTRGGETVLVVEDDPDVRRLLVRQLRSLGYTVVEAPDGPAALALLDEGAQVDLLLTDVVMPGGLNGPELARKARERQAELRVLFTSGFPALSLGDRGVVDGDVALLAKPYRKQDLAEKVRAVLD